MQTRIHKNTFKGCTKLASIRLPTGISAISDEAFKDCTSLAKADIGNDVTFIGLSAFNGCSSLMDVDRFNDNDSSHTFDMVGNHAFANTGLKDIKLALRSDVINTFWGDECFANCKNLTNVHILSANYLSKGMFKNCQQLSNISFNVNMMAYTYPNAFENCTSLKHITLPSQLLFLPEEMFKNCSNLQSVRFNTYDINNSGLTEIQRNVFYGCNSLNDIQIPESINSLDQIEDAALSGTSCRNISFYGLDTTQLAIPHSYPINAEYGIPIEIYNARQLECAVQYAAHHDIPVVMLGEYTADYYTENNFYTVYTTNMPKNLRIKQLNEADIKPYLSPAYLTSINKISVNNVEFDFSNKKYIMLHLNINVGSLCDFNGIKTPLSSLLSSCVYDVFHAKGHYKQTNDQYYSIMAYLYHYNMLRKVSDLDNSYIHKLYNSILTWDKNDVIYQHINNVLDNKYRNLYHAAVFSISKSNNRINKDISKQLLLKGGEPISFYDACSTLKENESRFIPNAYADPMAKIGNTECFRLVKNTNRILIQNDLTPFVIRCKNNNQLNFINYKMPVNGYVEPIKFESNKETINNFQCGIWYYNAKQLHQYAKSQHKPCLFIYSMLGCGPCGIYGKYIWNNAEFQEWCSKQNFYLCGIECESQPFYDQQLQYVSDLSKTAKNFINQGESASAKDKNQFNEQFSRIMTPVLIFMDSLGNCYDYTYHNIHSFINNIGVNNVIQCLKSLCLYHFDNNNIETAQYVVDANKPFLYDDYIIQNPDNKWKVADNLMDLGRSNLNTIEAVEADMLYKLLICSQSHGGLYLGGCLFSDIDYLYAAFGSDAEMAITAEQLNDIYLQMFFKIGNKYYQLQADSDDYKIINNPCGIGKVKIFKTTFVEVQYT